jgi:hypothetical protein
VVALLNLRVVDTAPGSTTTKVVGRRTMRRCGDEEQF